MESPDSRVRYSIEDLCRIAVRHVGSLVVDDDNPDDEEQLFVANSIDIDYERKRFLGMLKRDRTLRSIYNGTSKELKPNHSASERSFVFAFALLSRGFSKEFTEQMLLEWKYGIVYSSNKYVKRYGTLSAKDRKDCKRRIKLFVKKAEEKINVHSVVLTYMQPGKKYSAPALYRKLSRFMKIKYNRFQKILSSMRKLGVVEAVLEPGRRRKRAKVYYVRRKDYFL
ncbi:MAG: hypothetical protein J7L34_00740 [Thermotogaceae bacterium]|nr:hypothetical protein [Thermotogaceae bacterium]